MEGNFMPDNFFGNSYNNQMSCNQQWQSGGDSRDFQHDASFENQAEQWNSGDEDEDFEDFDHNTSDNYAEQNVNQDFRFAMIDSGDPDKQINICILDRGAPGSKMTGGGKKKAFMQALFAMMYEELLSDADIEPKFHWGCMVQGLFRGAAVGEASAEWLKDRVENMPPPWPGAKLEVFYRTSKLFKLEAYVPGELISIKKLVEVVKKFDRKMSTNKWRELGVRPHGAGQVFTLAVDDRSFKFLDRARGYVPFRDSGIEFRVLKDGL